MENNSPLMVLRIKNLTAYIGLSKSTIYNKLNPLSDYYDPSFPMPKKLGNRAKGWKKESIDAWLESLDSNDAKGGLNE